MFSHISHLKLAPKMCESNEIKKNLIFTVKATKLQRKHSFDDEHSVRETVLLSCCRKFCRYRQFNVVAEFLVR